MKSTSNFFRPGDTVLFQGDSITNAHRMPDEVNNSFQLGAGYAFLVASKLWLERPQDGLQFINRGVSGNRLPNLEERWEQDCLQLRPNVLSLLIGTNDATGGTSPDEFERTYRALLERTRTALPEVRLILCEPFKLPTGNVKPQHIELVQAYQPIVGRIARDFDAVFVPLQKEFDRAAKLAPPEFWIYDGVHPDAAGFALIAREWLRVVWGTRD